MADNLLPEHITPVVAWLCHEDCPVSGEIYSCGGGRVARIFIGVAPGYANKDLTVEDVRDNFEQIRSEEGYIVPANIGEETMLMMKALS
jgi:hypothetical protein